VPGADVTNYEPAVWGAAAGLVSTGRDMTRFVNALTSGEVISAERLAEMRTTQPVNHVGPYGLGLVEFRTACGTAWGHTGEIAGYTTMTVSDGQRSVSLGVNNTPVVDDNATAADAMQRMVDAALCS
jgi:D-alanyl-D-alanine carboxypeptidase